MTMFAVIEVVCESYSVSLCDRQHLMFAITVECCPLDRLGILTPVECYFTTVVTNC